MPEVKIRVSADGAREAAAGVDGAARSVESLGTAGDMARAGLSQALGPLGSIAAAAGPVAAVAAAVGLVVKGLSEAVDKAAQAEQLTRNIYGVQAATTVANRFGAGAPEEFVAKARAAGTGVSSQEAIAAASQLVGISGGRPAADRAFNAYLGLRQGGYVDPAYAAGIGGLMERGLSESQAAGLVSQAIGQGMSAGQVGGMGRVLGVARAYQFNEGEALALNEMVGNLGGGTAQSTALIRALGGDSPEMQRAISARGLGRAGPIGRLAGLADMRPEDLPSSLQPYWADIQARRGDLGTMAQDWSGALDRGAPGRPGGQIGRAQTEAEYKAQREDAAAKERVLANAGRGVYDRSTEALGQATGVPWYLSGGAVGAVGFVATQMIDAMRSGSRDAAREQTRRGGGSD